MRCCNGAVQGGRRRRAAAQGLLWRGPAPGVGPMGAMGVWERVAEGEWPRVGHGLQHAEVKPKHGPTSQSRPIHVAMRGSNTVCTRSKSPINLPATIASPGRVTEA